MPDGNDVPALWRILRETKTIAMVDLSANWHRPSYCAVKYLGDHGYRVIPGILAYEEVSGERHRASVNEPLEPPDAAGCFRRAEGMPTIAEQAVAVGATVP